MKSVVSSNSKAAFLWGFAVAFLLFLVAMSWVFVRDGPPPEHSRNLLGAVIAVLWIGGLGLAAYAGSRHCLTVTVHEDQSVRIVYRYPLRKEERNIRARDLGIAMVHESRDDDGYPYFYARVELTDGSRLELAEGHDRDSCERKCLHFNSLLTDSPS